MKFEILVESRLDDRAFEKMLADWHRKAGQVPRETPAPPPPPAPRPGELPFPEPPVPSAVAPTRGSRFPVGSRVIVDMRGTSFVLPHGTVCVLEFGRFVKAQGVLPVLQVPASPEVQSYLARIDFFRHAAEIYEIADFSLEGVRRKSTTDVLLEITPIQQAKDIHLIVGKVRGQARRILERHLGYTEQEISRFIVALSEVCQNIVEHSQDTGYVAIQKYFYKEKLGRNVALIAVTDVGVGMRQSLYPRLGERFGVEWNDVTAIRQAFEHGVSRYDDPGRGNGLRCVRELVSSWNGRISIRSGTAKVNRVPGWAYGGPEVERGLPEFPGTQIFLWLPQTGPTRK